ncbi:MAG TPA: recombinase family protein [Opitutus sp.]|nr:recombinase family protein [Opitutus sp.]
MASIDERLTEEFLRWSYLGRGIMLWDAPVRPEPAFRPFVRHFHHEGDMIDDGRKPGAVGGWLRRLGERMSGVEKNGEKPAADEPESVPEPSSQPDIAEIAVVISKGAKTRKEEYRYLFAGLAAARDPIAFELIGTGEGVFPRFAVGSGDSPFVERQLESFFPDASFVREEGGIFRVWESTGAAYAVVDLCLAREFMLPIGSPGLDPFVGLVGALGETREGEVAVLQVLFEPVTHPWAEHALRAVTDASGDEFFVNAPELYAGAKEKTSSPLFAACLRIAAKSPDERRVEEILRGVVGALGVFDRVNGNALIPVPNGDYPDDAREADYHLEGVSGKTVFEHPETKRMLGDIKRGKIEALIFSKLARLARNTRELLDFADLFRDAGADLVSLQESIDTSTPAGRLFYTMIAAMAQWEREEIASRVAASVVVRAKMGKSLGGRAPFGYRWVDRKLVLDPDEAPVRRRLYELFLEHKRKKTVARLMTEAGFRTRDGSNFSDTTVGRLIEDPTAKGKHRLNYTRSGERNKAWELKPESDWEYVEVEPVVSAELWDRCNAILKGRRDSFKRPSRKAVQLFGGLTFCECGGKMYVPSNSPKYICQKCRNKIPVDDLEAVFLEQLKGFFLSPENVSDHLDKTNGVMAEKEEILGVKRREAEKVQKEIDRVYRLYVDEKLTPDEFTGFFKPLQTRKTALGDEIPRLEAELDYQRISTLSGDEILAEAGELHRRWPKLSRDEKRSVVESITEKIVIGRGLEGGIEIELAYIPSSEELTTRQRELRGSSRQRA